MVKENLPLELLNKHLNTLELFEPLYIQCDNDLFKVLPSPARSAVVFLPKSKALIDMTLALVSGMVEESGKIILAGSNDAGIRSAKDAYEKNIGPVSEKIVGNHSALYVGTNKRLGAHKKVEDFLSWSTTIYGSGKFETAVLPGVFSAGELDEGTKLLLDHIPYGKKKVLDMACGSGVIGLSYKKESPDAQVTFSDSSKLAFLATQKTLDKNGYTLLSAIANKSVHEKKGESGKVNVVLSDVFEKIEGTFDLILCNPPFHTGVATDYSFIERFAKGSKTHLNPGGEVYVVANSFLPYKEVLEKNIGPTEILVDNRKFRVYRST